MLHPDGSAGEARPCSPALPLGLGELGERPDQVEEWDFPPGTTLLLCADGVTEARDARGVFYQPQERLGGRQFKSPDTLLDRLTADVALMRAVGRRMTWPCWRSGAATVRT